METEDCPVDALLGGDISNQFSSALSASDLLPSTEEVSTLPTSVSDITMSAQEVSPSLNTSVLPTSNPLPSVQEMSTLPVSVLTSSDALDVSTQPASTMSASDLPMTTEEVSTLPTFVQQISSQPANVVPVTHIQSSSTPASTAPSTSIPYMTTITSDIQNLRTLPGVSILQPQRPLTQPTSLIRPASQQKVTKV